MPGCFASGCTSGYPVTWKKNKLEGKKNPTLFSTPKDADTFALWQQKIPRHDRSLTHKDLVCSLHFHEEDIIKFDEVKLTDGTLWKNERKKYMLKKGAFPQIFFNCPSYLTNFKCKRKRAQKRWTDAEDLLPVKQRKLKLGLLPDVTSALPEISTVLPDSPTSISLDVYPKCSFSFEILKQKLHEFILPELWSVFSNESTIMYIKWTDLQSTTFEKRIDISADLSIKTFLYSREIKLENFAGIKDFTSVQDLICKMNAIHIYQSIIPQNGNTKWWI